MESFFFICREIGMSFEDFEVLDIGMCLDSIQEFIDQKSPKKKGKKARKATQDDFDNF